MLLAANIGRACSSHCRSRSRYAIRRLRFLSFCVLLLLTRNASLRLGLLVNTPRRYPQKEGISSISFRKPPKITLGQGLVAAYGNGVAARAASACTSPAPDALASQQTVVSKKDTWL